MPNFNLIVAVLIAAALASCKPAPSPPTPDPEVCRASCECTYGTLTCAEVPPGSCQDVCRCDGWRIRNWGSRMTRYTVVCD